MGTVLVLDAHARHALVAIQCLASKSLSVTAGSPIRWNISRLSRYVERAITYPAPDEDTAGFLQAIVQELGKTKYDMLLPIDDRTVEVVVKNRSLIEKYTNLPFPLYDQLLIGLDKQETVKAARKANIPHPKTVFREDIPLSSIDSILEYPIVVKSRRGRGRAGVTVCGEFDELVQSTRRIEATFGPVLFQEFIPNGGERGVYTLYNWSGEPIGLTVQHRLRSRPPEGGASTYRETVFDPELVEFADKFLRSLDWHGLAMVEFRIDDRTGESQLLEVNPRLWGSLALSVHAGVNFPYLLYQLAIGQDPEPVLEYEVDVRARCLFTDGLQVLQRQDKIRAVREFFTPSTKPCRFDIVSARDPLPVLGQFVFWAANLYDQRHPASNNADDDVGQATTPNRRL